MLHRIFFRKLAKLFRDEHDITKMQILNLGAKLHLTNPEQTTPIFLYVLELAKFDMNYDIRDRARLMRMILLNKDNKVPSLYAEAKGLFVNQKPAPSIANTSGSFPLLSPFLRKKAMATKNVSFLYYFL